VTPKPLKDMIDHSTYRVGGLFGIHFTKPFFGVVGKFYPILDTFYDTGELTAWGINNENLQCSFGSLEIDIDPFRVIIRSGLRLSPSLKEDITLPDGGIHLPVDLTKTFTKVQIKEQL